MKSNKFDGQSTAMTTNTIRKKLADYVQQKASPQKLKAIYALVERDLEMKEEDEIDGELLTELDKRSAEMEAGINVMSVAESDEDIKKLIESFKN
jgi:hypothetical protein